MLFKLSYWSTQWFSASALLSPSTINIFKIILLVNSVVFLFPPYPDQALSIYFVLNRYTEAHRKRRHLWRHHVWRRADWLVCVTLATLVSWTRYCSACRTHDCCSTTVWTRNTATTSTKQRATWRDLSSMVRLTPYFVSFLVTSALVFKGRLNHLTCLFHCLYAVDSSDLFTFACDTCQPHFS